MKMKERKNLAKKIAKQQRIIMESDDPIAVKQAEDEIMKLSGSVENWEDILVIDELVQELLEEPA